MNKRDAIPILRSMVVDYHRAFAAARTAQEASVAQDRAVALETGIEELKKAVDKEDVAARRAAIEHFEYGISHDIFSEPVTTYARLAAKALRDQELIEDVYDN